MLSTGDVLTLLLPSDLHARSGWTPILPNPPQAQAQRNGVIYPFQATPYAHPPKGEAGPSHIAVPVQDCRWGHTGSLRQWRSQAQSKWNLCQ